MLKYRMRYVAVTLLLTVSFCAIVVASQTWRLDEGRQWKSTANDPHERYLLALAELKDFVRTADSKEVKAAVAELKDEFPQYVGPDLELFIEGERYFWQDRYSKALAKYEKLLKNHPTSEFAEPTMNRQFEMAKAYFAGRKKTVLGFIKVSGYPTGVEIMEKISDRTGLDEPNSIGLKAAITVAEHYDATEQYYEGYIKWSEIASYWETGPVGKKALIRMAEDNLAAYNEARPNRRPLLDTSRLTTAKTYFDKYAMLYPAEITEHDIPEKLKLIDEQMAMKEYTVGCYYRRVKKYEAARLYFDLVVQNWPKTEGSELAAQALKELAEQENARDM